MIIITERTFEVLTQSLLSQPTFSQQEKHLEERIEGEKEKNEASVDQETDHRVRV